MKNTIEDLDREQEGIDWRADDLRRQIPKKGQEPGDSKSSEPIELLSFAKELEEMRHPVREPEHPPKFVSPAENAKAANLQAKHEEKRIATTTIEKETEE